MKSDYHTMEDLVMTKRNHLEVDYDTRQEKTQEIEEDWISSVLGSQDDTISELVYANS